MQVNGQLRQEWHSWEQNTIQGSVEHHQPKKSATQLRNSIEELQEQQPLHFSLIRSELEDVLRELHEQNKSLPIFPDLRAEVEHLVQKVAKQCNREELIELANLIQTYFSGHSLQLLAIVYESAKNKFHNLYKYCYIEEMWFNDEKVPVLTPLGAHLIAQERLKKKNIQHIFFPPVFHLSDLKNKVAEFYRSNHSKGVFLINFSKNLRGHFSPLIIEREKDILKVLNSDSVFRSDLFGFSERISLELEELPYQIEFYYFSEARQRDSFSCAIFSINDINEAAKFFRGNQEGFFKHLDTHATIKSFSSDGLLFKNIIVPPTSMMKLVQSMTTISELAKSSFQRKDGKKTTLKEYTQQHSYVIEKRRRDSYTAANLTAARKSAKYFEEILRFIAQKKNDSTSQIA